MKLSAVAVALAVLALIPACACAGTLSYGLGAVWVHPVGHFAETAGPTGALSMWSSLKRDSSRWGLRAEIHFMEMHAVDDVPFTIITGDPPQIGTLYTELFGATLGPTLNGSVGRIPGQAWLALGVDDFVTSDGMTFLGPPTEGAPSTAALSIALGGAVRLFGFADLGVEFLANPNAWYLDRPSGNESDGWHTVNGAAHMIRASLGYGGNWKFGAGRP